MTHPALRDRLAEIIKRASLLYPPGSDMDEGCRGVAAVILASEEWEAREAVVEAARRVAHSTDCDSARQYYSVGHDGPEPGSCNCYREDIDVALARLAAVKG